MAKFFRTVMMFSAVALAGALLFSCAAEKKKKYKINEQPPSEVVTSNGSAGVMPEWDTARCDIPEDIDGPAIEYLKVITAMGDRRAGSLAYRCAELYVAKVFRGLGYEVEEQEFDFPYYDFDPASFKVTRVKDGQVFEAYPLHYSAPLGEGRAGKLVRPWGRKDLTGMFVYVDNLETSHGDIKLKLESWKKAGALGVVREADMSPVAAKNVMHSAHAHSSSYYYAPLPGVIMANPRELIGETIEVSGEAGIMKGHGYNVIARGPKKSGKAVLVTGHLDSWFQGALDDGSGVAAMMDAARILKDDSADTIFIAVDSEELGLFGSAAYVMEHGTGEVGAVVELDMVSSKNNYGRKGKTPQEAGQMPRLVRATKGLLPTARDFYGDLGGFNVFLPIGVGTGPKGSLRTDMEWYWREGVPGVVVYVPSNYYHMPKDTIDWIPGEDLNAFAESTAALIKELRANIAWLPAPVNIIDFDFTVSEARGDTVECRVTVKDRDAALTLNLVKARVLAWYEFGYETDVTLKRGNDNVFTGQLRLSRPGLWRLEAVVTDPRAGGKKWVMRKVE